MPLYEYKCDGCGEVFEVIQKFSAEPLKVHEKCGAPVHRLLSAPALQFKGSGWYVNDYAKSNGSTKKESSEGAGAPDRAAKSSEAKSETKSDAKSDTSSASSTASTKPKKNE